MPAKNAFWRPRRVERGGYGFYWNGGRKAKVNAFVFESDAPVNPVDTNLQFN